MKQSTRIRIGDLNNDGLQDISGIERGGSDAAVLYQNNDGTLDDPVTYYAPHGGSDDLEVGDINHDGLIDMIVMSGQGYSSDNLAVLTQNSAGGFDPVEFYDLGQNEITNGVAVGDVNGDDWNDIIVSFGGNRPNSNIAVFTQNELGVQDPPIIYESYDIPQPVVAKDVNQDGRDDLVVLHGGWKRMGVYLQQEDGYLSPESLYPIPYASLYKPQGLAIGDINHDGAPDAVIADYNHGLVVLEHTSNNLNPVANAGEDFKVAQSTWVTLDGTKSIDPDGKLVNWSWTQVSGPAVNLYNAESPTPTFFARRIWRTKSYDLVFELTVTDDQGAVSKDLVQVSALRRY